MTRKPTTRQHEYWDKILINHKLGMGRGTSSLVDYAGDAVDLDRKQSQKLSKKTGRVKPKGRGPE